MSNTWLNGVHAWRRRFWFSQMLPPRIIDFLLFNAIDLSTFNAPSLRFSSLFATQLSRHVCDCVSQYSTAVPLPFPPLPFPNLRLPERCDAIHTLTWIWRCIDCRYMLPLTSFLRANNNLVYSHVLLMSLLCFCSFSTWYMFDPVCGRACVAVFCRIVHEPPTLVTWIELGSCFIVFLLILLGVRLPTCLCGLSECECAFYARPSTCSLHKIN